MVNSLLLNLNSARLFCNTKLLLLLKLTKTDLDLQMKFEFKASRGFQKYNYLHFGQI
jgi:hypothetical protein